MCELQDALKEPFMEKHHCKGTHNSNNITESQSETTTFLQSSKLMRVTDLNV